MGLTLLVVLLGSVDLKEVQSLFSGVRWRWVVVACAIIAGLRVIMSMRWQVVLASHEIHVSLWELIRITFISMFIGQFLPGSIGPDVIKGYELISRRGKAANITSTLLLDRFIGVYSMFCVALVGSILGELTGRLSDVVWPLLLRICSLLVAGLFHA